VDLEVHPAEVVHERRVPGPLLGRPLEPADGFPVPIELAEAPGDARVLLGIRHPLALRLDVLVQRKPPQFLIVVEGSKSEIETGVVGEGAFRFAEQLRRGFVPVPLDGRSGLPIVPVSGTLRRVLRGARRGTCRRVGRGLGGQAGGGECRSHGKRQRERLRS
jgi:hypothetical protein